MLSSTEKQTILRNSRIFTAISDSILAQIVDALQTVSVKAGDVVFSKGDEGTSMYIVAEGQMRAHDGELFFNYLNEGDVFGEMAALDPDVRSASITAEVDSTLLRLDQQSLYAVMSDHVEAYRAIIHVLCQHLRNRTQDMAENYQYQKVLERELEIGRKIQASFLPDALPQVAGWEIAAHFEAAREVAGDFYDAFELSRAQRIGLVVGDVCDKGVGAALFMTLFRSLIRITSHSEDYLGWMESTPVTQVNLDEAGQEAVTGLANLRNSVVLSNNYIARTHSQSNMFASLFFALLDPAIGALFYINGGHEAPIIFDSTGIKSYLDPTGPVVGVFPGMDFKIREAHLEPGDTLLAFSDGVIDARNQAGESFGRERLEDLVKQQAHLSAAALLHHITTNLAAFTTGTNQFDDITMLAVRRKENGI